jgi:hypothetical protein
MKHRVPKTERKLLSRYIREEMHSNEDKKRPRKHSQVMAIAFSRWHRACQKRGACK